MSSIELMLLTLDSFIEKNDASNLIGALSSDQSDSNFALITEAFKDAVPTAELEGLESYQEDEVLFGQFIKLNAEGQAFTQQELARLFNVNIDDSMTSLTFISHLCSHCLLFIFSRFFIYI